MITVTSLEFQRHFDRYQDEALKTPVTITRNGRERLVVLSAEEYQRLKQRDRSVLSVDQFSEADLAAILQAMPPPEAQTFNDEVAS